MEDENCFEDEPRDDVHHDDYPDFEPYTDEDALWDAFDGDEDIFDHYFNQ